MFGIVFEGHPHLKRILLPDEWQGYRCAGLRHLEAGHRLGARKPRHRERAISEQGRRAKSNDERPHNRNPPPCWARTKLSSNMGPQHPSTHGVLRVKLKFDGERVVDSECIIGYLHRGVEKIAETSQLPTIRSYVDRMD